MNKPILSCIDVYKSYNQGSTKLNILNGITLDIKSGDTISIVGSSGSGKSTLLHILAGLDKMTAGEVIIDGESISELNDNQICNLRNNKFGFIYQFHHLLPEFTAFENILMPMLISNRDSKDNIEFANHVLNKMGLINRKSHYPAQLSGGERQRIAIARAIINNPKIVFADEPTGNLDNHTSNQVLEIFLKLREEIGTTLIMVTHDMSIARKTNLCYHLHNGILLTS